MRRLRSMISQSPAIVIAVVALALSAAGGATAATAASQQPAARVKWHSLTLLNGWQYGGFGSFHAAYYVDSNHVVHLRGSAREGQAGMAVFRLPRGIRPSHILSLVIYTDGGPASMNILRNGDAETFGGNNLDFTSFDGVSFPEG
jgi:hypothetical protein